MSYIPARFARRPRVCSLLASLLLAAFALAGPPMASLAPSGTARAAEEPGNTLATSPSRPSAAHAPDNAHRLNILLLHSYHQGLEWTDSVTRGVQEELAATLPAALLSVEYMDTERHPGPEYYEQLLALYRNKFAKLSYDAVIVSDGNAFNFLIDHREELFPAVPVAFCGVNMPDVPDLRDIPLVTGVTQHPDIAGTIDAALDLHPGTTTLYVVNDKTTTGLAMDRLIRATSSQFNDAVHFEFLGNLSMRGLQEKLSTLPDNALVLLLSYVRDSVGNLFSYSESCQLIRAACNRPVYGLWSIYLGHGIIGGQLNSGGEQGKLALRQALKFVGGETRVPVLLNEPNRFYFDYNELQRFHINVGDLPPGSILANRPQTLYERHKSVFWFIGTLLVLLTGTIATMSVNIVARRRAERSKLLAERRYRNIFESAAEGIFLCSREGRILEANETLAHLLGHDSATELSATIVDIRSQVFAQQTAWDNFLSILEEEGRVLGFDARLLCKDGKRLWVNIAGRLTSPGCDQEQVIEGFVTDISSHKATEDELETLNRHLEDMVRTRTADMRTKTEELERANTRLLQLDDLKSSFLTTVSHDLRTPLTSIMGFVKLTMRDIDKVCPAASVTEDHQRTRRRIATNLEIVAREGERLTRLINDFLDLSKIESGQASWNNIPCDVTELIQESLDAVAGYAKEKPEVDVKLGLSGNLPKIIVDRDRIVQVLVNLLSNALKFTDEGHVTLTAWSEDSSLRIQVQDTGLGIAPENLDRVFDRFFQADTDTLVLARPKGTGMGLVICREILQHYSGRIWAESKGRGSAFHLELPLPKRNTGDA